MSDITINLEPTTEAEYKAACEALLLDMKQSEEKFDRLQAEIEQLRENRKRIRAEGDSTRAEINRMMQKLWGQNNSMWKDIFRFINSAASSFRRLGQAEENIKGLEETAEGQESKLSQNENFLRAVLHEFDKVRMQIESDKQIAARDYENLVLRLQLAMKDADQRALPPGTASQYAPDLQAQIDALKQEVEEIKKQIVALQTRQASRKIGCAVFALCSAK